MKKNIVIFAAVFLAIFAAVLLFFYRDSIVMQSSKPIQKSSQVKSNAFALIDEKDFSGSSVMEKYALGPIEFRMYPRSQTTNDMGHFEVYENGTKIFSSQPNYQVGGILSFMFGDNKYVVVKDYSGGAHCCDTDYLFRINKNNQAKLIKTFDMGNATISKDSLLVKNDKLYLVLIADSFQYFHIAYAYSYFFQEYYQLDGDNLILANHDFNTELLKTGDDCRAKIAADPAQPDDSGNYWLNDVVCYIANYSLAGKQEVAVSDFDGFFNKFFPSGSGKDAFGATINRQSLKQEIIDTLKNDRFK